MGWTIWDSNSGSNTKTSSSPKHQHQLWGNPASSLEWVPAFFPEGKAAGTWCKPLTYI